MKQVLKNKNKRLKRLFILTAVIILTLSLNAQSNFEEIMSETLEEFGNSSTPEEMIEVANKFERIASVDTSEWLPLYYASFIHCILSFRTQDAKQKETYIEKAQSVMDKAMLITENESELYTLQGMIYQSLMAIDPITNGQIYGSKADNSFKKATSLNPKNPRPYYMQAVSVFYTPEQFGGGKKSALPLFEKAMELYETFQPENPLYPNWGKEDCESQLESCKSS
ncbi:MAG: hypothetical protein JXA77_18400 [Bacteroidales bacterium]|nr:hypothetical protein [Bacteroidales bacterium]MBN2818157.1 hypothetical protein [Bacteroidales bacterium]